MKIIQDMLKSKSGIPKFVSYCALTLIKGSLKKKCGYDVLSSSPIDAVSAIKTPSLFIIGDKDDMVLYKKFLKMFEKCKADKKKLIVEIDAGHPDCRTEECIDQIMDFLGVDDLTKSERNPGNIPQGEKKDSLSHILESKNTSGKEIHLKKSDNQSESKTMSEQDIEENK